MDVATLHGYIYAQAVLTTVGAVVIVFFHCCGKLKSQDRDKIEVIFCLHIAQGVEEPDTYDSVSLYADRDMGFLACLCCGHSLVYCSCMTGSGAAELGYVHG